MEVQGQCYGDQNWRDDLKALIKLRNRFVHSKEMFRGYPASYISNYEECFAEKKMEQYRSAAIAAIKAISKSYGQGYPFPKDFPNGDLNFIFNSY